MKHKYDIHTWGAVCLLIQICVCDRLAEHQSTAFHKVMCCLPAGVIQGNVMKIKRGSMTHSINLCLITSDLIISDTDSNAPMHSEHQHKRFFKNRTSASFCWWIQKQCGYYPPNTLTENGDRVEMCRLPHVKSQMALHLKCYPAVGCLSLH